MCGGSQLRRPVCGDAVAVSEQPPPFIDKIFDADDGSYDGIAGQFDSVYGACMAIDPARALAALTDLKNSASARTRSSTAWGRPGARPPVQTNASDAPT